MAFCEPAGKGKAKCLYFVQKKIIEENLSKMLGLILEVCDLYRSAHLPSHLSIHPSAHPFEQPTIHSHPLPFIDPFLPPSNRPPKHSPTHLSIHPSIHTHSQPAIQMLICLVLHPLTSLHPHIHSSIQTLAQSSIISSSYASLRPSCAHPASYPSVCKHTLVHLPTHPSPSTILPISPFICAHSSCSSSHSLLGWDAIPSFCLSVSF